MTSCDQQQDTVVRLQRADLAFKLVTEKPPEERVLEKWRRWPRVSVARTTVLVDDTLTTVPAAATMVSWAGRIAVDAG